MKPILLCLHGWGGSKESFTELREALKDADLEILTPDLPGFGEEPEPSRPWNTDDYADWVTQWLANRSPLSEACPEPGRRAEGRGRGWGLLLLGHSHGGRIALKLASRRSLPIDHLYLCAAAGIRHPRHFKRMLGLSLAKTGKFLLAIPGLSLLQPMAKKLLYKLVRVHDYEQASPVMRQTLMKVSAEDLRPLLPQIHLPTDIFWGTDDRMTPVADGKLMHQKIAGSHLHVYEGIRHRVHRDRAVEIARVIKQCMVP